MLILVVLWTKGKVHNNSEQRNILICIETSSFFKSNTENNMGGVFLDFLN